MEQAVILAAGEGQRLRPLTVTKPKVMLHVAGKPILSYVIEALAENGIRNIVLVVGYRREQVLDYFGSGEQFGVEINYVTQERQLGTAHALAHVRSVITDKFLVLPGDNLIEAATIARFVSAEPHAVLIKRVDDPSRYGAVILDNGSVRNIIEKPREAVSNMVNTGIYAFTNDIFNFIEPELDIPDVLNNMILQGNTISAQKTNGTWLDVVHPWHLLSLNDIVLHRIDGNTGGTIENGVTIKGQVSVGEGTLIHANSYLVGPVVIGKNCDIGPNVCLMPSTSVGDNVIISPFSEIRNSIICNDVHIGAGCIIEDSIIDKGCVIKSHFIACSGEADVKIGDEYYGVNMGAIIGESCYLGNNTVAQPGAIVGNYSQVQSLKLITGRLNDRSLLV